MGIENFEFRLKINLYHFITYLIYSHCIAGAAKSFRNNYVYEIISIYKYLKQLIRNTFIFKFQNQ